MSAARKIPIPFPLPEDLTGRKIGRFAIRSRLGAGGMGEVWYAEDTELKRPVALKRLSGKLGSSPLSHRRILREARRACALSSDHIAGIHDVVQEAGEFFLVMEYVEGVTLRRLLQQPISLDRFFEVATQCADALAAAHDQEIVHCDIKPENIMLTPDGRVKVLDFGLAKHLPLTDQSSTLDRTGLFGGTPAYMSPEILREQLPDSRTDVFSLGIVFYEMLTQRNPFSSTGFVATSERILHENPTPVRFLNPAVPVAVEAIVMKTIAKDPGDRYANARDLLQDLRQARSGAIPSKSAALRLLCPLRKVNRWHVGVGLLAVAAAISFTFWWTHRHRIIPERGWVLISDFDAAADQNIPDKAVGEALTISLQQSRYVNVFPRSRIYDVLQRMKKANVSRIDESLGREICERENLRLLLAGNIEHRGRVYQIAVRGIDPGQGIPLFTEFERFEGEDQFFDKADSLARKVRSHLGESVDRIEKSSRPLDRVTTSSLSALQLYSRARDAQYAGRDDEVESLLKGALQLDPDFAMAHLLLGQYYSAVVGRNDHALAEVQRAYQLRQSVSERELHRIEAHFYDLQERYEDKAQTLSVLVNLYPDDEEAHAELAQAYYDLGLLDKAILEARQALRLNPFHGPAYANLALYLARDNRPDEAIASAREGQQNGVSSPRMHWALGLAFLAKAMVPEARDEFQQIGQGTAIDRDLQDLCVIVLDLYEGKLASARTELVRQTRAAPPQSGGLQAFRQYLLGRLYLVDGDSRQAGLQADLITQTPTSRSQANDLYHAGLLYAHAAQLAKARAVLHRLSELQKTVPSSSNQNDFHSLEGEILLVESLPLEAEVAFSMPSQAFSTFISHTGLARAYQAEQRWNLAAEEWQRVLGKKGEILQSGFPFDLASAHLELARTYRQLGRRDLARQQYEEALHMWQHADEHPLLHEAKRELHDLASEAAPPEKHETLPNQS
ncbi:MAG TPA: protein kinase [Candidatus Sulfotelmatobacter sp.]|nr:protein kinase [Candidatus Sulfotelmatobacter sp.]